MITLKFLPRLVIIVISIIVSGFLVSGVVKWRLAAAARQAMTSEPTNFDADKARVFLDQHLLKESKSEPSEAVDDMRLLLLGYDVEKFRDAAVMVSETKAMTELPQLMPGAVDVLLEGEISRKFPYIWPYVMAGSFIVIGNSLAEEPIVAFYNPYFDVALLTKWRFKSHADNVPETGFKLVQLVPITGQAFFGSRFSLSTDQPIWADSEEIFEVRIINAADDFVATFEQRYPPLGRDSVQLVGTDVEAKRAAITVTENRVFSLLRWVIDAQNPNAPVNYAAEIKQLRGALSADSPDELQALLPKDNPQTAETFFQLGADIRKGMAPYLVVDKNVIFLNPVNFPTGFISAYFKPADKGYALGLALLFSLDTGNSGN